MRVTCIECGTYTDDFAYADWDDDGNGLDPRCGHCYERSET